MKKFVALILTLVLVLSMTAVPVFADTIDKNGSASKNVTASYKAGTSAGTTVYSVTITWGRWSSLIPTVPGIPLNTNITGTGPMKRAAIS